jgi:hypothetical protein
MVPQDQDPFFSIKSGTPENITKLLIKIPIFLREQQFKFGSICYRVQLDIDEKRADQNPRVIKRRDQIRIQE